MENFGRFRNYLCSTWSRFRLGGGASALLLIFLTTFVDDAGKDIIRGGQIRALLCAGAIGLYFLGKRSLTKPIAAFWAWMAFVLVWTDLPIHGVEHFLMLSAGFLLADRLAREARLPAILSWLGAAQAAFGLAEWFGWNPWGHQNPWEIGKPAAFMGQETILGAFLIPCLAAALFGRRWLPTVLIGICLLATHSSFSLAGGGLVALMWVLVALGPLRAAVAAFLGLMAAGVAYRLHPGADWFDPNGRLRFWAWAWHRWLERPIFGFGPGSWLPNAPCWELCLTHAHNEFLEFLTEYGLFGAALLAPSLARFARGLRRPTWAHAASAGLLVDAFGNFPFHIAPIGVIFLACWFLTIRSNTTVLELRRHGG